MARMDTIVTEPLVVADADGWRDWLIANDSTNDGVWLLLAKKGITSPTSLTYAQAVDEALCSGWIDGQKRSFDATTFIERFTPRRARSLWSERNQGLVADLTAAGRMRERGQAEIDRAKADGRWDRAYAGQATATVPDDLEAALATSPEARARFDALSKVRSLQRAAPAHDGPERRGACATARKDLGEADRRRVGTTAARAPRWRQCKDRQRRNHE